MNTQAILRRPFANRKNTLMLTAVVLLVFQLPCFSAAQEIKTNFDDNIKSILRQRCASCHGPDSKKGDLDVTNFTNLMQGGSSGTVIEAGDPDGSYLFNLVTHEDEPVMPPDGKIPDAEIEIIRKWIETGALENKGSKAVIRKPAGAVMGANPLVRPEVVANWPRMPMEPVQHTTRNPTAVSVATSPWAPIAAVAGKNQVLLFDTKTLGLIGVLPFPEGSVNVVRFSRSGGVLLAAGGRAGSSGVAVLWDVATGERITTIGDELDAVLAADISPDHGLVALGGPGRVVNIYSTETGELKFSIKKHTEWVTALAFSTDGVLLASGDRNGGLHVWESWTARAYLTLKGHSASINSIAWRADSNVVASGSKDSTIRLWELNNGRQIKSWNGHGGGTNSIAFTRDSRIFSTGTDKVAKLWDQNGAQQKAFPAFPEIALSVAWCDESNRAIAGDYNGEIRVWNPDDASQLGSLTANPQPLASRLAAAQGQFTTRNAAIAPIAAKTKLATEAATAAQTAYDVAIAAQTVAQTAFDQSQADMAANSQKASTVKVQLDDGKKHLTDFTAAKPLLADASLKMTDASAKMPADEGLKKQLVDLVARIAALEGQIIATQASVTTLDASYVEITTQVKASEAQVQTTTGNLKVASDKVTATQAQVTTLNQASDAAAAELKSAQDAAAGAQAQVNRWQAEIDFVAQLNALKTKLGDAQKSFGERQQQLQVANTEFETAQAKSEAARQSLGEASQTVTTVEAEITAARQIQR